MAIKDKASLYSAYMPFLKNGGLFVPTEKSYQLGDETYLIITLPDSTTKHVVPGRVAWVTVRGNNGRTPGIGVHFAGDQASNNARRRIEHLLAAALKSSRPTLTI
jgi:type IV pilus assembly protein PilZ